MLSLLLDEHFSPKVAAGLTAQHPGLPVVALAHWQGGQFLGVPDDVLLAAAFEAGASPEADSSKTGRSKTGIQGQGVSENQALTLVTFDLRTIVPLLKEWAEQGRSHGGVIFVDERTLASRDFGGLVRALGELWLAQGNLDWTDQVVFLQRPLT